MKPCCTVHSNTHTFIILLLLLPMLLAGAWAIGLRVNTTSSMPIGLYRLSTRHTPLERGQLVALCPPEPWGRLGQERGYTGAGSCTDGSRPLLKTLAGVQGDTITLIDQGVLVNGRAIPASAMRTVDRRGRPLLSILTPGIIPPGQALVLAPTSDSFDGRYFGLVPQCNLHPVQVVCTL